MEKHEDIHMKHSEEQEIQQLEKLQYVEHFLIMNLTKVKLQQ